MAAARGIYGERHVDRQGGQVTCLPNEPDENLRQPGCSPAGLAGTLRPMTDTAPEAEQRLSVGQDDALAATLYSQEAYRTAKHLTVPLALEKLPS